MQQAPVDHGEDCQVDEVLGTWFRPNFDNHLYPYCPPHVKGTAKEEIDLYLVTLPKYKMLTIPKNYKVVAIPLYELYENQQRYGQILSQLPFMLSKFEFNSE
jgi:cleavage and polyadenylation specificity factor subunit 5